MLLALCCFDLEICTIVRNCGYFLSTESGIEVMLTLFKFSFIHTALNAGVAWPRLVTYKYVVDKNVELQKCWTENWRYSLCHPPTIALWFNFFFNLFLWHFCCSPSQYGIHTTWPSLDWPDWSLVHYQRKVCVCFFLHVIVMLQ